MIEILSLIFVLICSVMIACKENVLEISLNEMSQMHCNFFSIDENIVVSEKNFVKINNWLKSFDILVEEIDYNEVSKQGGLLRCSTLPLIRA